MCQYQGYEFGASYLDSVCTSRHMQMRSAARRMARSRWRRVVPDVLGSRVQRILVGHGDTVTWRCRRGKRGGVMMDAKLFRLAMLSACDHGWVDRRLCATCSREPQPDVPPLSLARRIWRVVYESLHHQDPERVIADIERELGDDDWITTGFSRIEGRWVELGHSIGVRCEPPASPPELPVHEVADQLNAMEELMGAAEDAGEYLGDFTGKWEASMCERIRAAIAAYRAAKGGA